MLAFQLRGRVIRNWQKFKEDGKVNEEDKVKEEDQYIVRIIVRKMRNKAAGHIGTQIINPP